MPRGPRRLLSDVARDEPRRRPSRFDVLLGLALALVIQLEYLVDYSGITEFSLVAVTWGLLLSIPLIWRRVWPVPVGLGVVLAFCVQPEIVIPTPNTFGAAICIAVASAALAMYPRRWATAIAGCVVVGLLALLGGYLDPNPDGIEGISSMLFLVGVWVGAAFLRAQTERTRRSEEARARERVAAENRARELVASERSRIARELHDIVSHGMGVLVLQARGGRRVLDDDPVRARTAFDEIERVSTDCLNEMRLMLDVLRIDDGGSDALPPQPGMRRLDDLLGQLRAAGLRIDAEVSGEPVPLATGLDVSAYRIVQEALTNVAQHGAGASAALRVDYGPGALRIDVSDDGPAVGAVTPGHGLTGMAERAHLFDGVLEWGPRESGGFRVVAELPYRAMAER
jgi:signal transduction histidine kinase